MRPSFNGQESRLRQSQPLILYGMHRSGTSLMVRLLSDLGIFMGSWLSRDAESVHFQRLNRRIYSAAGSTWGEVSSLLQKMRSDDFVNHQTEATRRRLFLGGPLPGSRPVIAGFFGRQRWACILGPSPLQGEGAFSWGFKDPRTTLALPIWLRLFPRARYVHILRNGIDVAISIHRRSLRQQRKLRNHLVRFDYIPATLDFAYCFHLWELYVSFALEHRPSPLSLAGEEAGGGSLRVPGEQYYELRYEDLLAEPKEQLGRLLEFLRYPVQASLLSSVCERIDASRRDNAAYATAYQDKIAALAASPLMRQFGYTYPVGAGSAQAALSVSEGSTRVGSRQPLSKV